MQTSTFLAKLLGPLFVVAGVGMLANPTIYRALIGEFLHSYALIYLAGLFALLAGLAIVNVHNLWHRDWRAIITVLGWLMLIGGIVRIVLPRLTVNIGNAIYGAQATIVIVALVAIVLGGFLSFKGYRS